MRKDDMRRERAAAGSIAGGSRPARQRKRRKHKRNFTLYYILFFLIFIITFSILSLTVLFKIENITITGIDKYSQEQLMKTAGISIGDNLFRISKEKIIKNLMELPYVEEVSIKRDFPPSVYINITQSVPAAAIKTDSRYTIINSKGRVLETGIENVEQEIPIVTGLLVDGLSPGQYVSKEQDENLIMLTYLMKAINKTSFTGINLIDISDRLDLAAVYDNRILLELGSEGNLDYKLKFAADIIQSQLEENFEGILDLTINKELRARPSDIHKLYDQLEGGISHELPDIPEDIEKEKPDNNTDAQKENESDEKSQSQADGESSKSNNEEQPEDNSKQKQ